MPYIRIHANHNRHPRRQQKEGDFNRVHPPHRVIGVGHLGSLHAKLLRDVPGVQLAGIYDERPDHAAKVARNWEQPRSPTSNRSSRRPRR